MGTNEKEEATTSVVDSQKDGWVSNKDESKKEAKNNEGKPKSFIKKVFSSPSLFTAFLVIVGVVMSFFACIVQSSGFQVSVTKGIADMDAFYTAQYANAVNKPSRMTIGEKEDGMANAKIAYQLYMPKGVDKDHPAPAIALTHGYLNSKEFEEAPAIELSRRGFVVFQFDQYDHGDSTWDSKNCGGSFGFFMWSAYDAVEYLYAQDYVKKDADGNGMIMVSGHSMGGFSSQLAVMYDEVNVLTSVKPYRMLAGALPVGADDTYTGNICSFFGTRTIGNIAGEYDEFFYNSPTGGTVRKKTPLKTQYAENLFGTSRYVENGEFVQIDPVSGKEVTEPITDISQEYGERVMYVVSGDHPYNTWSPEATDKMVNFYFRGFEHQLASHGLGNLESFGITEKGGQTWWLKVVFTCLGLIAILGAVITSIGATHKIPVVGGLAITRTEAITPVVKNTGKIRKGIALAVTLFSILLSAWLIPAFMDKSSTLVGESTTNIFAAKGLIVIVDVLMIVGFGLALILGIVALVNKANKKECDFKAVLKPALGGLVVGAFSWILRWVITDGQIHILGQSTGGWFNSASVNTIAYWAIASGLLGLIFTFIHHFFINKDRDSSHLGLRASWKNVLASLCTAIVISGVLCAFVWIINLIFKTDFRVYTYAFKTINGTAFLASLRYLPLFFIFYLCAGISVASATAGKKGWKADLLAVAIEAGPSILFLLYQYIVLETTGVAPFPNFALNGILVQGLVIPLAAMAVFQRRSYEKTGNIWTGVFLNTIIFTFAAVGNTILPLL